jgi:D-amino-acid dehydrogenase
MKVIVMGAGVIGVTTAWYLARAGAEVVVLDRQTGPGLETSYANAGELSYGMTSPWAAPGVPLKALKWLFMKRRPLFIWPLISPTMWAWGIQMLQNCTEAAYAVNKARMVRISNYSRDNLPELIAETGIEYDGRAQGTLQLFRTQKQLDGMAGDVEVLKQYGVSFEVLDRDGFCRVEPALRLTQEKFVGALRLPNDETGDCFTFTSRLAGMAAALGVRFRWNTTVERLEVEGGRVSAVRIGRTARVGGVAHGSGEASGSDDRLLADRIVLALGSHSPRLLSPVGVQIPVYPVKGYSITVPITDLSGAPESTVMDETHKAASPRPVPLALVVT